MDRKMRSTAPIRIAKTGYIIISSAICALGLIMIMLPDFSIRLAGTMMGVLLIVFGAVKIIGYLSRDLYRLAFQYDLAFGILMVPLGLFAILHPEGAVDFFYIILGIVILADGLFKLQMSLDSRAFGIERWWVIFLLALFAGAVGCALMFQPTGAAQVATLLVGVALLAQGMLNMSAALFAVKIVEHQRLSEV